MPNWDKTPWNAGPGELPGDPENDPALHYQCDCCGHYWPREQVLRVMPGPHSNAPCETWACPECRGVEPEEEEPEPIYCDSCRRQFAEPPKDHNIETYRGGAVSYTCDNCLEELAIERLSGRQWEKPE